MSMPESDPISKRFQRVTQVVRDRFRPEDAALRQQRRHMNESVPGPFGLLEKLIWEGLIWLFGAILLYLILTYFFLPEPIQETTTQDDYFCLIPVLLFFMTVLIIGQRQTRAKNRELMADGVLSKATIVDRWSEDDADRTTTYYLGYTFPEGEPSKQQVKRKIYNTVEIGDIVPVRYIRAKPWWSRLEFNLLPPL